MNFCDRETDFVNCIVPNHRVKREIAEEIVVYAVMNGDLKPFTFFGK